MKAAVQYEAGKPLVLEEVQLEDPQDDEIKVKLVACGVCHSDLTFMKGDMPAPMPLVVGHEGAGIVEKVGPRVTSVKPGDHVLMMVSYSCGKCPMCAVGEAHPVRGEPARDDDGVPAGNHGDNAPAQGREAHLPCIWTGCHG